MSCYLHLVFSIQHRYGFNLDQQFRCRKGGNADQRMHRRDILGANQTPLAARTHLQANGGGLVKYTG